MDFNKALQMFDDFKNNTQLDNYSFMPDLKKGFNIYDNNDRNYIINKFGKNGHSIYLVGLSNNIINKRKYDLSKLLGLSMFGKWSDKNKIFVDVSVLLNDMSEKGVLFLAKYYNQKVIIKVTKNKVTEIVI